MSSSDRPEPGTAPVSSRHAMWSAAVAAALVVALGLTFYGINAKYEGRTAAKQPAVLASPAPVTGVAPLRRRRQPAKPRLLPGRQRPATAAHAEGLPAIDCSLVMVVQELGELLAEHFVALLSVSENDRALKQVLLNRDRQIAP